jgi:hypothetical protein
MTLGEHENIIGAWAENPSGPGWSNQLIWVCIRDSWDGKFRVGAFQPEEFSSEMNHIFKIGVSASNALLSAAISAAKRRKPKRKPTRKALK